MKIKTKTVPELDGGAMFGVVSKVLWSKDNLYNWAMCCLETLN